MESNERMEEVTRENAIIIWQASRPVSYTHLDVYKRQSSCYAPVEVYSGGMDCACREKRLSIVAVSYTHLVTMRLVGSYPTFSPLPRFP